MVPSNCDDLHYRADAVDLAMAAGINRRPEPDRLPPNIYGTEGDWETYSTPSRDARLKTAFKELRDQTERFVKMYQAHDKKLVYQGNDLPLCLWIMKEYFEQIPRELDEAALVDGASPYRAFWDIILPLARPALGATAIIGFLTAWNEYEFALVLTSSEKVRTISVAIASLIGEFTTEWNQVMAAAAVGTVPVVIVFVFFQKQLMQGLTGGAVKG